MRNLLQYPITLSEVIECLKQLQKECNPDAIGNMTPLLLQQAIKIIERERFFHGGYEDDRD